MLISDRLANLRALMKKREIDAYIIPSSDPHLSEYPADHWKSREWISGFDGSAGTVVITKNHAGLWTDSRYFIQAENQLKDSDMELHKVYDRNSPSFSAWLKENLKADQTVGIDGFLFSKRQEESLRNQLSSNNIKLITHENLIDDIWEDKPALPSVKAFEHTLDYTGRSLEEKILRIRNHIKSKDAEYLLLTALDDIVWTLNIRSNDADCNPSCISYLLIGLEEIRFYVDAIKAENIKDYLISNHVSIYPYKQIQGDLGQLSTDHTILTDKNLCNIALYDSIQSDHVTSISSIVQDFKSVKNETEIKHFRKVMVKDGIALLKAFHWLDQNVDTKDISEYDFAMKIAECRSQHDTYFGESFYAIVGFQGNGAIVHYRPSKEDAKIIKRSGMLLCDSGGQYFDGTTDITRTIILGEPTDLQKKAFSLVLKGHIDLDMAVYPQGTVGGQIDILARQGLWEHGMNYNHGTGHGVGFFLNVHEGPQGISPGFGGNSKNELKAGMVTSNEPGYYLEDEFGIRIENLILTIPSDYDGYLKHETLSLYPIDKRLIDTAYLDKKHIDWLNQYHEKVWNLLSPHIDEELAAWLKPQCSPL